MSYIDDLGHKIYDICHLNGDFTLRSGQKSTEYFDKYLFESYPSVLADISVFMSRKIREGSFSSESILAGLETGGIPLATLLSQKIIMPMVIVRKQAKEYGTCKLAEGIDINGAELIIIEDVVTTGGQIIKSVEALRGLGARIYDVYCVILRDESAYEKLSYVKLNLKPLFVWRNGTLEPA